MAGKFFYCLDHQTVETAEDGCRNAERLGPYDSEQEAAQALQHVADRNSAWDNDPRWNDDLED